MASSTQTTITHPGGTSVSVTTTTGAADAATSLGELVYFPVYAKGLQLALIAEMTGLEWTGATSTAEGPTSWAAIKATGVAPFGQMPILKTPSGLVVGQSTAIANYMGRVGNLQGASDDDFAMSQMCLAEAEDIYSMLLSKELARWKSAEARASKAEEAKAMFAEGGSMQTHLANLERLCGRAKGFTTTGQTAGEIYLYGILHQVALVAGAEILAACPKLNTWYNNLGAHEAVKKVLAGESAIGKLGPYFMNDADHAAFNA